MKKKNIIALALALCMCLSLLAGCAATEQGGTQDQGATQEQTQEQTQEETQASVQDVVQEIRPVLLVVSFGTSYNDSRDVTIGAIESALRTAYPQYEQRRAFTAQTIIDILAERENLQIDNVTEAMEKIVADGVKDVIVQPTHIMSGYEYDDLVEEVSAFSDQLDSIKIGAPLLTSDEDFQELADALVTQTADYDNENTAIVFMGHGTEHAANETYPKLQQVLRDNGKTNYYVGTVEASPTVDDILEELKTQEITNVVLLPLMVVAGDHATNDMAGDEADSWKSVFTAAGYEVECVLSGLGQIHGVRQMYVKHAGAAMGTEALTYEEPETTGENNTSAMEVPDDGTYAASVESSSSMFNVVACDLTVDGGQMIATITMNGDGYGKMFMGTAEEADAADESAFIEAVIDDNGAVTFALPIDALGTEVVCAAWSIKKETWYDRTLVFSLAALSAELPQDGQYLVDVTMTGGTGRVTVESPCQIDVQNGAVTATVVLSSKNYEYLLLDGEYYYATQDDATSTFEIPIVLDETMNIAAQTTAMGTPHEIEYELFFDAATLRGE